jgi:hypothetical protein
LRVDKAADDAERLPERAGVRHRYRAGLLLPAPAIEARDVFGGVAARELRAFAVAGLRRLSHTADDVVALRHAEFEALGKDIGQIVSDRAQRCREAEPAPDRRVTKLHGAEL